MKELLDLLLILHEEIKFIKAYIKLLKETRVDKLKNSWLDGQDVLLTLHISKRTLQTLRNNGTLPYSKIQGKFYYKVSDVEELLQSNYYNYNFKCDGAKQK